MRATPLSRLLRAWYVSPALVNWSSAFSLLPWTIPRIRQPARCRYLASQSSSAEGDRTSDTSGGVPFPNGSDEELMEPINGQRNNSTSSNMDLAALASSILTVKPEDIEIVTLPPSTKPVVPDAAENLRQLPFVSMFRGSANYIANHRDTLAVYHIPGGLLDLDDPSIFRNLMNDIALTWLLGMRVVIVAGCRHQIEQRLGEKQRVSGLRVTDKDTLRVVKEEAGFVRFEVERELARALRLQGAGMYGNVVSGNFYSAKPFGVLEGVDYQFTGSVRRVETEKIKRLHESRDICLLTTLGVSPSGEVFNVNSESLAATVAGKMKASKVIYFTEKEIELRSKEHENVIQNLRQSDAKAFLNHTGLTIHRGGFSSFGEEMKGKDQSMIEMLHKIGWSIQAVELGVTRAHIISPKYGSVLQELYTRDGSGTLISRDIYEGIRRANVNDVSGIHDLISPLIRMGTLIDRPKSVLEKDIDSYYVYTRDNLIVACGQLKKFENGFAEIGCLVVNPQYRKGGRGDKMLGCLERMCLVHDCSTIFVLSTQTAEWFLERGFEEVSVDALPPSRQATYNNKRRSKIYMKLVESVRDLDASELFWNHD